MLQRIDEIFTKKLMLFLFVVIVLVSVFLTYKITSRSYESVENRIINDISKEVVLHVNKLDSLKDSLRDFYDILGMEYEHDEENFDLEKTLEEIKNKTKIIVTKNSTVKFSAPMGKPLDDIYITSEFGSRYHPVLKKRKFHRGVDLRANIGSNVYSTAPGVVRAIGYNKNGYGKYIIIQHNMGFETIYAHLDNIGVSNGTIVKKGDIIGLSGNTGRSTGPHLHYETRFGGQSISPIIKN